MNVYRYLWRDSMNVYDEVLCKTLAVHCKTIVLGMVFP